MKSDGRNIGIDALKAIACAGVVIQHFGGGAWGSVVKFDVPVFMFVSIYLSGNTIQRGDICHLMHRMKRLYIPFALWGILYFLTMCVEHRFSVSDLLLQLTIGVPACPPLYFIFLLAANTVLIFLVARSGRYALAWLGVCC